MSNPVIAFLAAIASTTWLYTKIMRSSGNNTGSSVTVAAIAGLLLFAVFWAALAFGESLLHR